jgi:hypothetical protein
MLSIARALISGSFFWWMSRRRTCAADHRVKFQPFQGDNEAEARPFLVEQGVGGV